MIPLMGVSPLLNINFVSARTTVISIMIQYSVKGRQCTPRARNFFLWANIANAWLPIQTYRETSKGRNFNSKAWIKIPLHLNLQVRSILCAHIKILSWTASQSLKHYLHFYFLVCNLHICGALAVSSSCASHPLNGIMKGYQPNPPKNAKFCTR